MLKTAATTENHPASNVTNDQAEKPTFSGCWGRLSTPITASCLWQCLWSVSRKPCFILYLTTVICNILLHLQFGKLCMERSCIYCPWYLFISLQRWGVGCCHFLTYLSVLSLSASHFHSFQIYAVPVKTPYTLKSSLYRFDLAAISTEKSGTQRKV